MGHNSLQLRQADPKSGATKAQPGLFEGLAATFGEPDKRGFGVEQQSQQLLT